MAETKQVDAIDRIQDTTVTATDKSDSFTEQEVKEKPKTWKSFVWDTWELEPEQRWLLFKVDAFVLTFASIGYFLKNIDQTNVNNAFLSGMKEDLNMYGNELVTSEYLPLWPLFAMRCLLIECQVFLSGLSATSLARSHPTCFSPESPLDGSSLPWKLAGALPPFVPRLSSLTKLCTP